MAAPSEQATLREAEEAAAAVYRFIALMVFLGAAAYALAQRRKRQSQSLYARRLDQAHT